jgi:hypothetical protein
MGTCTEGWASAVVQLSPGISEGTNPTDPTMLILDI